MTDIQKEENKTKQVNKLAVFSFWAGVMTFLAFFLFFPIPFSSVPFFAGIILFFALSLTGLALGIGALVQIKMNSEKLIGRKRAVFGIAVSLINIMICLLVIAAEVSCRPDPRIICGSNLTGLGKVMLVYAQDNNELFPEPDKWCDLLVEHADAEEKLFICPGAERAGFKAKCHYAMNPNVKGALSPFDMVLFFETKGGWNQFGGLELITAENHDGIGCNVGFQDTHVEFVRKEDFDKLNWGDEKDKGLLIKD